MADRRTNWFPVAEGPLRETLREPGPGETRQEIGSGSGEARSGDRGGGGGRRGDRRRNRPIVVLLGFVVVAAAAVGGELYWEYAKQFEETDNAFVEARAFAVAPKVAGYVLDVRVTDNQHVDEGETMLRIDPRDFENAVDLAVAQVEAAKAQIATVRAQIAAQVAQQDQARAQIRQAQAALTFADAEAQRYGSLAVKGVGTLQRSQQASADQEQRRADCARAEAALKSAELQVGVLEAQRRGAEANRASAEAQLRQARLNLSMTDLKALQAGTVTKLSGEVGQYAQPGRPLMMFVPDKVWVTANFKETQITRMRRGQLVELVVDAYPERRIEGYVDSLQRGSGTAFSLLPAENATGNYVKVVQRVPVKIAVPHWPPDIVVGPGMSVVPRIRVQ